MAAGDIEVYETNFSATNIDTALTGNGIVVADDITVVRSGSRVIFVVVKAA